MLELVPLCAGTVEVGLSINIGTGPAGARSIGVIEAASFTGDRLKATLIASTAADWMVSTGTIGIIDVRMGLRTDDDALIYMQYGGRLNLVDSAGLFAHVAAVFETGDERYAWLNAVQAVGKGKATLKDGTALIDYEFYTIG